MSAGVIPSEGALRTAAYTALLGEQRRYVVQAFVRRWRARNVRGVFLLNVRADHALALPRASFSWVVAGNMVGAPALHRVGNEIHQVVKLALEQTPRPGCRRPALAVPLVGEGRQGFRRAGGFWCNWFALISGAAGPPDISSRGRLVWPHQTQDFREKAA